jgi:hypothetical protein
MMKKKNSLLRTYVVAKYTQRRMVVVKDKLTAIATKEHKQNGRNFSLFFLTATHIPRFISKSNKNSSMQLYI